jgi:hypothetical protein
MNEGGLVGYPSPGRPILGMIHIHFSALHLEDHHQTVPELHDIIRFVVVLRPLPVCPTPLALDNNRYDPTCPVSRANPLLALGNGKETILGNEKTDNSRLDPISFRIPIRKASPPFAAHRLRPF